jgi:hypothetical protein
MGPAHPPRLTGARATMRIAKTAIDSWFVFGSV